MAASEAKDGVSEEIKRLRVSCWESPSGNIYRGWAVGLHHGFRDIFMTITIMLVQLLAPIGLVVWTVGEVGEGSAVYFWETDEYKHGHGINFVHGSYLPHKRVLGTVLMMALYLNFDHTLHKQSIETNMLRRSCKVSWGWLCLDSLTNSIAVMGVSLALPLLFFYSDSVKDLVINSVGLIFLNSLDDYSSDFVSRFTDSDFADAVAECKKNVYTRVDKVPDRPHDLAGAWAEFLERFTTGDCALSFMRQMNLHVAALACPAYAMIVWVPGAAAKTGDQKYLYELIYYDKIWIVSMILFWGVYLMHLLEWWKYAMRHDAMSFLYIVVCRSIDPRDAIDREEAEQATTRITGAPIEP